MLSEKAIARLGAVFAVILWILLVATDLSLQFSRTNNISIGISSEVPVILLNAYIFCVYLFYRYRINRVEGLNFVDLLWKVFVTGLLTTVISLTLELFSFLLGNTSLQQNLLLIDFFYLINLGVVIILLVSTFIVWKRLILYQKSKFLLRFWNIFEYALLISLIYNILPFKFLEDFYIPYLVMLVLMGLFLSANMKWVAYLNFKQKWKSILLIALTILYMGYFYRVLNLFLKNDELISNFMSNVFLLAVMVFILIYAVFSLLVILFNLPTSSVFEQKLEEVLNFQRLSQTIQTEQNEEQVFDVLLQSSVSTVLADAAWVEVKSNNGQSDYYMHKLKETDVAKVKDYIVKNKIKGVFESDSDRSLRVDKHLSKLKGFHYRSIMGFQIIVQNEVIGTLALLKEVSDGFNKEAANIIKTFVSQAGVSIENFRLLEQAIENERYKEELKIAKTVQSSLLPEKLNGNEWYDICGFSHAADEVGGDYYDTYQIDEDRMALIIADVSGKGTSAAFHMSQMKGVFNSLCQLDISPKEFMTRANAALSVCLDRNSFITASYFIIDTKKKELVFSRAGHCPTLHYCAKDNTSTFFEDKGLGLGILRNAHYENYVNENSIQYLQNDIIVLYTDGITEAQNKVQDEFGYERLKEVINSNKDKGAEEMSSLVLDSLYEFSGTQAIDDDYTMVIIKFK